VIFDLTSRLKLTGCNLAAFVKDRAYSERIRPAAYRAARCYAISQPVMLSILIVKLDFELASIKKCFLPNNLLNDYGGNYGAEQ
jgi:hypothetical protein